MIKDILQGLKADITQLQTDKKTLRKFGLTIFFLSLAIALLLWKKTGGTEHALPLLFTGLVFAATGILFTKALKWPYLIWMSAALAIGTLMSSLILFFTYYLIFVPAGIILRVMGKDLLRQRTDKEQESYWTDKEEDPVHSIADYQNRF